MYGLLLHEAMLHHYTAQKMRSAVKNWPAYLLLGCPMVVLASSVGLPLVTPLHCSHESNVRDERVAVPSFWAFTSRPGRLRQAICTGTLL